MKGLPPGFLSPDERGGPLTERTPPRRSCEIKPLIDGDATSRALEHTMLSAGVTLDLAFWQFNPDIETLTPFPLSPVLHGISPTASTSEKRPFSSLIVDAIARGVTVRVFLSDFEPLFDPELHIDAWKSYNKLARIVAAVAVASPAFDPTRFQMMCARHPATIFPGALEPLTGDKAKADALEIDLGNDLLDNAVQFLNDTIADEGIAAAREAFDHAPALWPLVAFDPSPGSFRAAATPPFSFGVASHHVKLCIADDTQALLGGFNINGHLELSRPRHTLPHQDSDVTHDVHLDTAGPVVTDLKRFFCGLWNASLDEFTSFLDGANAIAPGTALPRTTLTPAPVPTRFMGVLTGARVAQAVRTVSGHVPLASAGSRAPPLPEELAFDTNEVYRAAIEGAQTYIYIENQYFRWPPLADRIARAMRKNQKLQTIVVLPFRPEETGDPATLHGNAVQFEALTGLTKEFSTRFGLFTFVSPTLPADVEFKRARTVYIHSKILVVDDVFALVGSANFNGRSMLVDTEIGVAWTGGPSVKKFRESLWKHALGAATDQGKPEEFLARWHWRAFRNNVLPPPERTGFVVHLGVDSLAKGFRADNPLNPKPAFKPLAPALDVYSNTIGADLAARKRPPSAAALAKPSIS